MSPHRFAAYHPSNVAFLLQQRAEPGQILISEKVFRHIRGYFNCNLVGKEKLKNRTQPIAYHSLLRKRHKRSKLEIDAEQDSLTSFVNRHQELSMMKDLYGRVKSKKGQVLCIVGDAGRGKSRLIYEFNRQLPSNEFYCLESQCLEDQNFDSTHHLAFFLCGLEQSC